MVGEGRVHRCWAKKDLEVGALSAFELVCGHDCKKTESVDTGQMRTLGGVVGAGSGCL